MERMDIEYSKKAIKYINTLDRPTKKILKDIPEVPPEPGEIEAIEEGRKDRKENGTVSHSDINWD